MKKIIVLVLLLCVAGYAHAEMLINGDFEDSVTSAVGWGSSGSGSGATGWMSFYGTFMTTGGSDGGPYMNLDTTAGTSWAWLGIYNDTFADDTPAPVLTGDVLTFSAQIRDTSTNQGTLNVFYMFFDSDGVKIDLDGDGTTETPQEDRVRLEYTSSADGLWSPVSGIQAGEGSIFHAGDGGTGAGDYGVYTVPTPLSGETIAGVIWFCGIENAENLDLDELSLNTDGDILATNVNPPDGAINVVTTTVLEWDAPSAFTPIAYDVYISITDPNADKAKDQVVDHVNQDTYDPNPDLANNTKYYWRVNAYDPCDVIQKPGRVWSFTTIPTWPVFATDAESTTVEAGSSAQFDVETLRNNTFQWWKDGTPDTQVNNGDDGGDVSVVSTGTTSTLTIANAEQADEAYYYCVATGNGSTESNHARLLTKRLMGHWKFLGNLNDEVAGNNGTYTDPNNLPPPPGTPSYVGVGGINGPAISLDASEKYVDIPNEEYFNFHAQGFTINLWVKTEQEGWGAVISKVDRLQPRTGWSMEHEGDAVYMRLRPDTSAGSSAVEITDNEWHMLTGTYDEQTGMLALYIDGAKQAEAGPQWWITETDMSMKFGNSIRSDHDFVSDPAESVPYEGLIDDVKIYCYAQDGYEIATAYTNFVPSASICVEPVPVGDLNGDCVVNAGDLAEAALDWLRCNLIPTSACGN